MSLHDDLVQKTRTCIAGMQQHSAAFISPSAVAVTVHEAFSSGNEDDHVTYASIEHCKQIARKELAGKFSPEGQDNVAHQEDMFSGVLQEYYPLPRKRGDEPQYKLRELLSSDELKFNIDLLRKSARARLEHADALEAFRDWRVAQQSA
jgi:hypothetical protein